MQVPVILIGNKIDLRSGEVTNEALMDGAYKEGNWCTLAADRDAGEQRLCRS